MCGIIGYVGPKQVESILLEGLERLEYRGYDSAGISLFDAERGEFETIRAVGNLAKLREAVGEGARPSHFGIGHTRWATHGRPAEHNAHPFRSSDSQITVVLNGIIENYIELREELTKAGFEFQSETDAEVVPFLVEQAYNGDLIAAVKAAHARLEGHFAIVVMHTDHPDTMVGIRRQCPLVIGVGDGETYIASAIAAFLKWTKTVQMIEDDEIVVVTPAGARFLSLENGELTREAMQIDWDEDAAEKGGYETFTLKEINEQPDALENTLGERMRRGAPADLSETGLTNEDAKKFRHVVILGCGTSYHAGLVGRYMMEGWTGLHAEVDLASEWRHRDFPLGEDTLVIGVTQSGETADTLAAMEKAKICGAQVLALTNVLGSQATRIAHGTLYTRAGLEIGVASTKAHVAQVMAFSVLAMWLAEQRESMDAVEHDLVREELQRIPDLMRVMLESETWHTSIREVAERFSDKPFFMFLGRHVGLPVALEAALKLKELSYIPSDAYAAGEMKHGPIALLDTDTPTVVIATDSHVYDKTISNIQEVRARGAAVIAVATEGNEDIRQHADHVIYVPRTRNELMPLVGIVPLQLLAYHIATARGLNVDQPRNLAKTVTVE
ncbi:MAG: glucosamine/fructose-6-phosphate aminotransferase, isomerizing [Thermoleophilia bacterium]|nr:glucosamine/fructose-6-phosphate aminotransferase, isomerizing [Thermoleophilia bacterium]